MAHCPHSSTASPAPSSAHPQVSGAPDTSHCPAFSTGCPFSSGSSSSNNNNDDGDNGSNSHPAVLSADAIAQLKEHCAGFRSGGCPFSGASAAHPKVSSLAEATKCPEFQRHCPFAARKDGAGNGDGQHPDISNFWTANPALCKAFQGQCPFSQAKMERSADSCPFLAAWRRKTHPNVYSLDSATDCAAFKRQSGCPFRAASRDEVHRFFGLCDELIAQIKAKCPAFSAGCPFSASSTAHPAITDASQVKDCPAFRNGGCVFNPASNAPSSHPNIGALFQRSVKECSAFAHGCPFATVGRPKRSAAASLSKAKANCPAFKQGCPFASAKSFRDFARIWSEVPPTHFDLIPGSDDAVKHMLCSIRRAVSAQDDEKAAESSSASLPAGHPNIPPSALKKAMEKNPDSVAAGVCPMGGGSGEVNAQGRRKVSMSSLVLAELMASVHVDSGQQLKECPAFKSGCAFGKMRNSTFDEDQFADLPLKEAIAKCPAFKGRCPFAA